MQQVFSSILLNSITAFEVGMIADHRMKMVVSFSSQKRDCMRYKAKIGILLNRR